MGGSTLIAPHKSALRKAERQGTPGMRRAVALVLWLVLPGMGALAQDFPVRTVRIISPTGPGGGTDILARLLAHEIDAIESGRSFKLGSSLLGVARRAD